MKLYNMHEAKTHLSRIVRSVAAGETVLIGRGGEPIAVLSPYRKDPASREPGSMRGQIELMPDFDAADELVERLFIGPNE